MDFGIQVQHTKNRSRIVSFEHIKKAMVSLTTTHIHSIPKPISITFHKGAFI